MSLGSSYPRTAIDTLLLRDKPYADMREQEKPFVRGLTFIVVIGIIVAIAGLIGSLLEWASTPRLLAIKDAVWEAVQEDLWFGGFYPTPQIYYDTLQAQYNMIWNVISYLAPGPWNSVANIVLIPLRLLIVWLIYGALAHLYARALGGNSRFGQTYGAIALGTSAQLLNALAIVPFAQVGGIVAIWGLACNFIGLKFTHGLSGWRAFWATILPLLTIWLLLLVFGIALTVIFGALLPSIIQQMGEIGRLTW